MLSPSEKNNIAFPAAIVIVGIVIAASVFFIRTYNFEKPVTVENSETKEEVNVRPVTSADKILGNPNADVLVVEYSDFECPYCQAFHSTMNRIMDEYGREGKVAWVYRHFPLEAIHKNAKGASIASECVNKIGGNEKFWEYANLIFASAPGSLSAENLQKSATDIGIDSAAYNACLTNPEIIAKVELDIKDGMLIYENDPNFGTPYSFIITKSGIQTTVIGSQDYTIFKQLIDQFI